MYWDALKASLPRWRAGTEKRQGWQQALNLRSQPPVIDPDVMGPVDLKNPISGKAFEVWQARQKWLKDQSTTLEQMRQAEASELAGLDKILESAIGLSAIDMVTLRDNQRKGEGIAARLEQLNLTNAGFSYLLKIRGLAEKAKPTHDGEWKDVYAILTHVEKQREFAEWRNEEREKDVVLSPKEFKVAILERATFPPIPLWEPLPWRASWDVRRAWVETLQLRIDQEQTIIDGLVQAVSTTEGSILPMLRDALIMTLTVGGDTLESKAKWVTDNFLIDTKLSGCQVTTRVGQAITTLQSLLWQLRTKQSKHPELLLQAPDFDEDWATIGSYAAWRAGMFVFMYPENILLPSFRRMQTPAFRTLVAGLRANKRLTPDYACRAANAYSDYFRDVCSLSLEACAEATTDRIDQHPCRLPEGEKDQGFLFLFARSNLSNKVYWSTHKSGADPAYAQTFWAEIPGLEGVLNLVGAVTYEITPQERFVCVFARVQEGREQKLVFTRYDLEKGTWQSEVTELELPEKATSFTAKLKATAADEVPSLGLWLQNGHLYLWNLSPKGDNWDSNNDDQPWKTQTVFAEHRDVSVGVFNNNPKSTFDNAFSARDVAARFTAVNDYAYQEGYLGGFPNFYEAGTLYGTILLHHDAADWRDILAGELGNPKSIFDGTFSALDVAARFGAVNDWAYNNGYFAGFPNFHEADHGSGPVYGSILIKPEAADWRDIPAGELGNPKSTFDGTFSALDVAARFAAVSVYAHAHGYLTGFPTFHEGPGPVFGAILIKHTVGRQLPGPWQTECPFSGIKPNYSGPFDIPAFVSETEVPKRTKHIADAFKANPGATRSHLTYFEEAWYFVPLQIALQLHQHGHYIAALDWFRTIYDYSLSVKERKIYYGLTHEAALHAGYDRNEDWLQDNLNPHAIAQTRRFSYTRFTLLSLIRCFLDYADAEFTRDTPESVERARTLYLTARSLLDVNELKKLINPCESLVIALDTKVRKALRSDGRILGPAWEDIMRDLNAISEHERLNEVIEKVTPFLSRDRRDVTRATRDFAKAADIVKAKNGTLPLSIKSVLEEKDSLRVKVHAQLLTQPDLMEAVSKVGAADLGHRNGFYFWYQPGLSYRFCIPPNPVLQALGLRAELNLYKLRNCRNIAGMERQLEAYAAPTDAQSGMPTIGAGGQLTFPGTRVLQPTPYRFKVLIERAKQLGQLAGQIEANMLSAFEKRDAEAYSALRAKQDVQLSRSGVKLQDLRMKQAEKQVILAELQEERSQIQVDHYQGLLDEDISANERAALVMMWATLGLHGVAAYLSTGASVASFYQLNTAGGLSSASSAVSSLAAATSTQTSILSTIASYERRKQDWEFQRTLAQQDVRIGTQQVKIAEDSVGVVRQEHAIAELQSEHADAVVEFLSNKFTNVELYDWMSDVLEGVYSYFLQQTTAVAKLAEDQLAFERHETPAGFIQADYWEAASDQISSNSTNGRSPDRRGLTGSARLLQDIYQLEQYAFDTDKRKLQLSKTISMAGQAPIEFQRFREMGVIALRTPLELFDRDFPGHYVRLIKRVRMSVVALIPPVESIKASLTTTGLSRVVIGGDVFQLVLVRREPEMVALSSPRDATGLFELEPQSEMLFPFEATGVDASWEFRMPKAANRFDYSTIADVLLTIEYTALNSFEYRQQVIKELDAGFHGDRPFSFRHNFADQWYDLHNPDQTSDPMVVRFKTTRQDLPPNLESLKVQHVVLYFGRREEVSFEISVSHLLFTEQGSTGAIGGGASSIDGVISTRRGNAGSWTAMIGKSPFGEWELALPNTEEMRNRFKNSEIEDILFVITCSGRTPAWPD
jgi:hypothetical protein